MFIYLFALHNMFYSTSVSIPDIIYVQDSDRLIRTSLGLSGIFPDMSGMHGVDHACFFGLARNALNTAVAKTVQSLPARQEPAIRVSGGGKTAMAAGICRVYLLAALVFVAAAVFFVIGALGT